MTSPPGRRQGIIRSPLRQTLDRLTGMRGGVHTCAFFLRNGSRESLWLVCPGGWLSRSRPAPAMSWAYVPSRGSASRVVGGLDLAPNVTVHLSRKEVGLGFISASVLSRPIHNRNTCRVGAEPMDKRQHDTVRTISLFCLQPHSV